MQAALLTGCRYGELAAMQCNDFNSDTGSVYVRSSKGGKARHVTLSSEGGIFFVTATVGKLHNDLIFLRSDRMPWAKSHQARPLAAACARAKISPPISFHTLRHTHASHLAMRRVPLMVIAHHSRTRGHTHGRKALCASCTLLCGRCHPCRIAGFRNCDANQSPAFQSVQIAHQKQNHHLGSFEDAASDMQR